MQSITRSLLKLSAGTLALVMLGTDALAARQKGAPVTLVSGGKPVATIVLAPEPCRVAEFAALELNHHIRQITGTALPVVRSDTAPEGTCVFVGDSAVTRALGVTPAEFDFEEYTVAFFPNAIVLAGHDTPDRGEIVYDMADLAKCRDWPGTWDERGTMHATYEFLEECCGVRWLTQTEYGTVIPETTDVVIKPYRVRRAPAFRYRDAMAALADNPARYDEYVTLWPRGAAELVDWQNAAYPRLRRKYKNNRQFHAARSNMARLFTLRRRNGGEICRCNHSLYGFYNRFWEKNPKTPELFVEKNPAMFAKGFEGKPPQMCYTSKALIKQLAQDARDYYDGRSTGAEQGIFWRPALPNLFPVEPMDNSSFCRCDSCQAFFTDDKGEKGLYSKGTHSNYFFNFVNEVCKELNKTHPNKAIVTLAYMTHAYMPDFKLDPNVAVQFCFTANRAPHSQNYQHELDILKTWAEEGVGRPMYLWLYYTFPKERAVNGKYHCFPGFFAHTIDSQFKLFHEYGIRGMFHCGYGQEIEAYVTFRMMDDPTLNVNRLLDEYFTGLYGKAAKPLKSLYLSIERVFSDPELRPKTRLSGPELNWSVLGTEKRMRRYARLMAQAHNRARTARESANVKLFEKAVWKYMVAGRKQFVDRQKAPIPSLTAPRLPSAEGDPTKIAWDRAADLGSTWYDRGGKTASSRKFAGRVAHDGEYLYIELTDFCDTAKLQASAMVFPFDDWEIFIAMQRDIPFRQYAWGPTGLVKALSHGEVNFRRNLPLENPGVRVRSDTSSADRWVSRVAIPLEKGLPGGAKPGQTVYLNILRVSSPGIARNGERLGLDTWVSYCTVHEVDRLGAIKLAE